MVLHNFHSIIFEPDYLGMITDRVDVTDASIGKGSELGLKMHQVGGIFHIIPGYYQIESN